LQAPPTSLWRLNARLSACLKSIAAPWVGVRILQRMFPVQKVRYMYFTGEFIDAHEAHRLGAVERVVPRDQLVETALEIAAKIAEKSPAMISLAKEALTSIEDGNLEDKYRREQGLRLKPIGIRTLKKREMPLTRTERQTLIPNDKNSDGGLL